MKCWTRFISFFLLLLTQSCALPYLFLHLRDDETRTMDIDFLEASKQIPEEEEDFSLFKLRMINPIYLGENIVIAGEPQLIGLEYGSEYDPIHIQVRSSSAQIEKTEDPTRYRLLIGESGIQVEIIAIDTLSGVSHAIQVKSVGMDLPLALLPGAEGNSMSKTDFHSLGQIFLQNQKQVPLLCKCNGFKVERKKKDGAVEQAITDSESFSAEVKLLVKKAEIGDIYIFDEISVSCPGYSQAQFLAPIFIKIKG